MALHEFIRSDIHRSATLYIAIGVLSLVKAIIVRQDADRFRRELMDAVVFLSIGIVLHRVNQYKNQKREELLESVPGSVFSNDSSSIASKVFDSLSREPTPEPTMKDRAREFLPVR